MSDLRRPIIKHTEKGPRLKRGKTGALNIATYTTEDFVKKFAVEAPKLLA